MQELLGNKTVPHNTIPPYHLAAGYRSKAAGKTGILTTMATRHQSGSFAMACFLAHRAQVGHIIDIGGCVAQEDVLGIDPRSLVVVAEGQALEKSRQRFPQAVHLRRSLKAPLDLPQGLLQDAVVFCHHQLELLEDPTALLQSLSSAAQLAPYVVVGASDRSRLYASEHMGPPKDRKRYREWTMAEFETLAQAHGLDTTVMGYVTHAGPDSPKDSICLVAGAHAAPSKAPQKRVLAIISCFNDEDIITDTVEHLLGQDVDMWFVDNWSSDATWSILEQLHAAMPSRIAGIERFPKDAPDAFYNWHGILERKEAIAIEQGAQFDWFIHYDSDEHRTSPWPGVTLGAAISAIDAMGYNAIDHTLIDFRPTQDGFDGQKRAKTFFGHFEYNRLPSAFCQIKGWAKQEQGVDLRAAGGHEARFAGRKIFPLKFLLSHYPLRSTTQARKKVFQDRLARYAVEEKALGWHVHYKQFEKDADSTFIWDPQTLLAFDDQFFSEHLLERLTGQGLRIIR